MEPAWRSKRESVKQCRCPRFGGRIMYCSLTTADKRPTMSHFIANDGARIHVRISGEGRPDRHVAWLDIQPSRVGAAPQQPQPAPPCLPLGRPRPRRPPGEQRRCTACGTDGAGFRQPARSLRAGKGRRGRPLDGRLTLWQYVRDFGTGRLSRLCIIDQSPKLSRNRAGARNLW